MAGIRATVNVNANIAPAKRSLERATNELNKIINGKLGDKKVDFNVNSKSFTQPLGRITASANEFTKSLEASNARVIAFGASVGIINGITDSFKFLIAETVRFEKTLVDINAVLNSSNQQLEKFGQGLFDVAQNTAQSFNLAADAALEFSRQGLSVEEVLRRTNDALLLTRITSLDAAEAVAGLTAAVNAFGQAGLTTTDIVDKLAAVDVKFAVSSEDLINGLERAGAVAIDAGVSLDSLIGIITSLQQTTARGGAVIGNGLKTIFTRIQRPESIRQLEDMGIAVKGLTGAILPADQILKNIARNFDALSQSQQSNIVQFSAGIFQANIFRAALTDLSKAQGIQQQATEISGTAAGEAARKNEILNKSISALASQAGTGLRELVGIIGELGVKPEIGGILEFFGERIEEIKKSLGGGEDAGSTFAKGIVRGIGNILTGPGLIAFSAIFTKLLFNVFKFASSSLKDVLGIVSQKEKIKQIEQSIVQVLGSNLDVTQALNNLEGDRVAQERLILGLIEQQTRAMAQQQRLAANLAKPLLRQGVSPDLSSMQGVTFSSQGVLPEESKAEKAGAMKAGYTAGPVAATNIEGIGRVIYNKAETIKTFSGMKQPAIMPPEESKAGKNYKSAFSKKHGFDPYASKGFVPNYNDFLTNDVASGGAKMFLKGTPFNRFPRYIENQINEELGDEGSVITFNTQSKQLKTSTFHNIGEYLEGLGVHQIETKVPFSFIDLPVNKKGRLSNEARKNLTSGTNDQRGDYASQKFIESSEGAGYRLTNVERNAVMDAVKAGAPPSEHKAGEIQLQNIFEKSIRRYSNKAFREQLFGLANKYLGSAKKNNKVKGLSTDGEIAESLINSTKKLEEDSIIKNLSTLARMGEYTLDGMTHEETVSQIINQNFRRKIQKQGIGEKEHAVLERFGLSKGFVPNYADPDTVYNTDKKTINGRNQYELQNGKIFHPNKGQVVGTTGQVLGTLINAGEIEQENYSLPVKDLLDKSTKLKKGFPLKKSIQGSNFQASVGMKAYYGDKGGATSAFDWSDKKTIGDKKYEKKGKYDPESKINDNITIKKSKYADAATSGKAHNLSKMLLKASNTPEVENDLIFSMNKPDVLHIAFPDNVVEFIKGQGIDGYEFISGGSGAGKINLPINDDAHVHDIVNLGKQKLGLPAKKYIHFVSGEIFRDYVNAGKGYVPNFSYRMMKDILSRGKRPLANYGIGYDEGTNGKFIGETLKNKKKFLTEWGFKNFSKYMSDQGKPVIGIRQGTLGPRNAYWINSPETLRQVEAWGKMPNLEITSLTENKAKEAKEQIEKQKHELKFGKFESTLSDGSMRFDSNLQSVNYSTELRKKLTSKLGKDYRYIEYNRQMIEKFAKDNDIMSLEKFSGGNYKRINAKKAVEDIINLPASKINELGVFRPRKPNDLELDFINETRSNKQIKWKVQDDPSSKSGKSFSLQASNPGAFESFQAFLKEKGVPLRNIENIQKKINERYRKFQELDKPFRTMGAGGRESKRMTAARSIDNMTKEGTVISTDGLYIKNLGGLVKEYNQKIQQMPEEELIPNFASTTLYRGTSPKYDKAVRDIPNPPQFLFDEIMAAKTKSDFIKAVKKLGISHSMGAYSGSYNDGMYPATIEQMRGYEKMDENQILHGGYVYPRPMRGGFGKQEGADLTPRHQPSGFVSRTVDKDVAKGFAKSMHPGYEYDPNEMGNVEKVSVPNKRIFDQTKLEKYIDRFGLENVKKSFKQGMRKGTLKDIYLNLHKFRPKVQSTDPLDMFSPNAGESDRSIGMSGGSLTRDEKEIAHIWSKRSPYFGAYKGLIPNFLTFKERKGGGSPIPVPDGPTSPFQGAGSGAMDYLNKVPNFSKRQTITDEETGTKLHYRNLSPGYAEIMHTARGPSDLPGGAFKNFKTLMGKFESVGSGFLVPQRNGVGPTGWAKILSMFPQLKNRVQPGLQTMGDWVMHSGYDPIEIPFDSLKQLKSKVTKFYNKYPDDISLQPFGGLVDMDEANSFQNLTTIKVQGEGDAVVGFKNKGLIPNFLSWRDRPGGGSKIPVPDSPGMFSAEEVDQLRAMGYKRTDHHGWHFAEPIGLQHTPPTNLSPFGLAGPVSFDFLTSMIQHDREMLSIPNPADDNANLDDLGQSLIKGQKSAAIIGYDSTVNRMQLIEGNHRVAALARLNEQRDKTEKFYTGMHAYVSGVKLKDQSQMDHSVGFVNQQIYPPKIPDDVIEAKNDPYRGPDQYVQGSWSPSDFGIPNFYNLNRRNLSDGDKMSDRQRLLAMWQAKMDEKAPYAKKILDGTGARIELDPIISELNEHANDIWEELQKLKRGEEYKIHFPFEIPNFAVNLSTGKYGRKAIGEAIKKVYKSRTGKDLGMKDLDFPIERYIAAIADKQADDPKGFVSNYPGGEMTINGVKFPAGLNEISMALMKHGQFLEEKNKGLIPNFSHPLTDAINREKAAGIPESMIRIDRSSQLMGPQNPMGIAVINTRDEPQGVQQGINRARAMGIDPRKHGMQVPNFASEELNDDVQEMLKDFVAQKISDGIQKALDSATNVRSVGENISNDDFEKAGFSKNENNFKHSAGYIKRQLEKGDTKESLRVNQETKTRASSFKLQAEQKLKSLEKNPTGTKDEAEQIAALNRVIEGLGSLGSALDEHANSISDDTKDYIKELAKTQNGIKDASKEQIKSAAESGMSPKIKDTIKEGSADTNQLRAAADQARAQLTKDEQTWKNSKGQDKVKALEDMKNSRERVLQLKASEDMINKETEARKNGLQQLFYFQSMISMANGFLQQMSETGSGATKVLADLGIAASDTFAAYLQAREIGREASEAMGVGEGEGFSINPFSAGSKKGKKARLKADEESRNRVALGQGGMLENLRFKAGDGVFSKLSRSAGEAGTAFGRLIPAIGHAYAAFTLVDSSMKFVTKSSGEAVDLINSFGFEIEKGEGIMALFKNGVEKAQSRIDKLGKSAEVTAKALEAVKSSQENSIKIAELEQLGVRRTLKQDRELHELQVKEITGKTALTQARTQLTDADLMGKETAALMAHQLSEVSMSGKDTEKLLRSLNVVIQRNIMLQHSRKNFEERQDDEANFMDYHTIGATIGGGILATVGTVLTGGTGLIAAGAIGLTGAAASGAAGGAVKDEMFSKYDISGVNREQMETMTRLMEGRAHEILDEYSQALYGGDKDLNNRTRTLKEKVNSYEKNMDVINRAIASHADHGPSAMISILDQLHGSEGFGEQSREELINALKDYINTGADMQDNPTHAMLGGEKLATDKGLSIIAQGMKEGKGALEKEDRNKIQAEINMKTVKIQERLFRNLEMELKNQSHRLDIAKKSLELDNEINTIKESLLSEHGFILNSVQIENQNARKRKSIDAKFESTKQNINAKVSEQFIELSKARADFKNISPSIVGATMSGPNKEEIQQGGMSLMAEAISKGGIEGSALLRGTTLEGSLDDADIQGEISRRFDDIGIKAEKYGVAIENARKFFEVYSKNLAGVKDGGAALTGFAESVNNVSSPLERYAILMMGELSGLASASDSGKGLAKMMETLRKAEADLESANVDYAAEIRKNEEQLRNKRISEKTLLGAGLLERQIVDDKIVEKQPEVMEKTFEGQAAYYNALNKVSKERIDILTRSKNFELSILANLQNELTKSSESDLKSLKQAEFKNKIFATNKDLLTSAVSRVLTEAEEVKLSNKNKEVKLQMISDQEYIASLTKSQIESEILDSQISQKQAEEKRKLLESTQYARMLAESQAKNDLESARISRINNEQKLIAQVANGDISSLVGEELKSKLASTRTEALKAAESAIQLQLNKEQTKKIQKANELLDLSNKFTAMQNAEMLANSSSENIRLGNQIGRSTDQFNMIAGARSAVDMAAMTGNPDDKAEATNQLSELERSITGRSGALTMLAQKMAEVEVAASSLSADLASNLFDGVRSGFGKLLTDIATGAETAGDAWENFGLGVAKQLLDRVMQHNIDKMMSNLTYSFTGVKNDPESQQKMLANITSKSTSATKKLTEKIEALKRSLESGISLKDKGSGELDSSLKPGSVTEISNRLSKGFSSVTINAEDASVALSEVSTKATNLANFFEEIYKPEMKKLGEKEGSSREVQSRYEMMQQRAARNNSNLESAQRVASITEKNKTQNRIDIESIERRIKDLSGGADMNDIFESTLGEYADSSKKYSYGEHTAEMKEQYAKINYGRGFGSLDQEERDKISDKVERFYPKFEDVAMQNDATAYHAVRRKDKSGVWREEGGEGEAVDFSQGKDKARHIFIEGDTAPIEFDPNSSILDFYGLGGGQGLSTEGKELTKGDYSNFEKKQAELNNKKAEIETQFAKLNDKQTDAEVLDGQAKIDTIRIESLKAEKEKLKQELEKTVQELSAITNALKQSNIKKSALRTELESLGGTVPSLPAPKVGGEFFGGKIQHFHDGGFVRGEPGQDKVPAMLTAGEYVVPKEMMQAFREGGKAEESRVMAGLKGSAQMVTMALVAEEIADAVNGEPEDKAPTFDMKKLNAVDIGSDVNITRGDPRMSARAIAKDPVMKEYKDYLLKKASFDVQKKNEKFQERMGMLGTVVGAVSSFAISQVTELLKEPLNDLVSKGDNFVRGTLELGKHSDAFKHDSFPDGFNYRDINESGGSITIGKGKDRYKWNNNKWSPSPVKKAMGGQIPAMLTAGEAYVPAEMAKKIGYDSLNRINKEGIIQGPGGIDNVGPVGLNPGDFIIRKSSTDKLLNANPNGLRDSLMGGGFTRRATQGYYNGGMAGDSLTVPSQSLSPRRSNFDTSVSSIADQEISATQERTTNQGGSSATTNNINVSVKIDSSGRETVESSTDGEGSYEREKDLSMKIKSAVLDVIRQEKRVGGELS